MWQERSSWAVTKRVLQAVEGDGACPYPGVHAPEVRAVLVGLVLHGKDNSQNNEHANQRLQQRMYQLNCPATRMTLSLLCKLQCYKAVQGSACANQAKTAWSLTSTWCL